MDATVRKCSGAYVEDRVCTAIPSDDTAANKYSGTPSGDEIVRFIDVIIRRLKPRSREVPSYAVVRGGLRSLIDGLIFKYPEFSLTPHEQRRIEASVNSAVSAGGLTKDPLREKLWAGVTIVRRLVTAILTDALNNGVPNWDIIIQRALSIVMMAALASRSGDFTRRSDYNDHELAFLAYKDVWMKLVGGEEITNIQAEVVIRNEKGHR